MFVILKSMAGCDYQLKNKIVKLRGGCYANDIDKADFDEICATYQGFKKAIDEGYIVVNDTNKQGEISKAVDDTKQADLDKQTSAQAKNAKSTGAKVKKG